jgi:arginyl-tRNA--protein-N-Asp/Glu arginylyltransferase
MTWEKTICYICGKEAHERDDNRNLRVECFNCHVQYSLSIPVQEWRLDKENHQLLFETRDSRENSL